MDSTLKAALTSNVVNGWSLFSLITVPISLIVIVSMTRVDLGSAEDISSLIQLSVRCSVPWLYLAFAASSIQVLFPGDFSRWLMRNRRVVGLCFAAAMAWQLLFILMMVIGSYDYYVSEVYLFTDIMVQIPGYVFLIAMTVTSFMPVRRKMNKRHWRTLHIVSIDFLWGTVWSTYWYELYYYEDIQLLDYFYYWTGFSVWGLRVSAWSKKRLRATSESEQSSTSGARQLAFMAAGATTIVLGIFGIAFGSLWATSALDLFAGNAAIKNFELFVPFLPIVLIALGAFPAVRSVRAVR